jgi:hypothetical protein
VLRHRLLVVPTELRKAPDRTDSANKGYHFCRGGYVSVRGSLMVHSARYQMGESDRCRASCGRISLKLLRLSRVSFDAAMSGSARLPPAAATRFRAQPAR